MRVFTLLFILCSFSLKAQVCSGPGRTPQTAIAICGVLTFPQPDVPSCTAPNLAQTGCPIDPTTTGNSVWYKFHCYQSGTLGFLITPASGIDDYDWAIMNVTGRAPQEVLTTDLVVSLNISGFTGNTGCSSAGLTDVNCAGNTNVFNRLLPITLGNDYLLMVTNWSNSGLGYDLTFVGGTAIITNNLPPTVNSVGIAGCNAALIMVVFSEDILCNSLTSTGTEFSITNGTHTITSISSLCSTGSSTFTELSIALQTALLPGNYSLVVNNGSDLNTLLDACQDIIPPGSSFPFTVPAQIPLAINVISYTGCAPSALQVSMTTPVLCNSITATGSEFLITPGNHPIVSVQTNCAGGSTYTNNIQLILQDPLPFGNYQLVVNNGADGNSVIDTCGTALPPGYQHNLVITQVSSAPAIQSVSFDECKPFNITVNFDKPVACNSVSANGSEFSITPGVLTVTGISSNCSTVNYTSQVIVTLSGNLPAGNFNVNIENGSDGNTLSDTCFSFMPANSIKPFATTQTPLPRYDSLQYDKCNPSEIKVFYSKPITCASVSTSGTEFYITGPVVVGITSVSADPATCTSNYSSWFIVHLAQPINTFGTYLLHNKWGSDNNSVLDTCYALQDTTETISFNVLGKPSPVFADEIRWGCAEDTIILSHPGGNGINSWSWSFSDGSAVSGQSTSHTFPVSTIAATVQLIISNGICSDTLLRTYSLNNAINATFYSVDTSCKNTIVTFTNNSSGNSLQYQWQFGDNTAFAGQSPPPHSYAVNDSFHITLVAVNNHGCSDTATKNIIITAIPVVEFTGLNAKYCTGESVSLTANLQGNISSYSWNNGNGAILNNAPVFVFPYSLQGNYVITLSATDRFCGVIWKNSSTKVYKVPIFDLGADKTLCPGITTKISGPNVTGYTYLWTNGSTDPQITTAKHSETYKLNIDNNGCMSADEIFVKVLDNCLIKVAGAFTPNGDGTNDKLKAINADLATNFLFRVYNRFGELLFSTTDPLQGWNGRYKGIPAETGTYVWQLNYNDPVSKKPVNEKGASILLR
ncbi:MAG: PKD domain-containing protein [Ferruginibacter sp.]